MKVARFQVGGWESYGLVENDQVRAIQGDIFGEHKVTQASYPLEHVKLLPPTTPTTFWAVGLNYSAHLAHQEKALDMERIRREASQFRPWHKGAHCMIGHGDTVLLPPEADYIHYEGELAIVIGRPTRRVTPEEARHFIFGYTCANDITSEGAWQADLSNWRRKGCDTFGPVGPWIETDLDPHSVEIITRLNGKERDRGSTSGMHHNCWRIVSGISQFVTLRPGDVILTGAPGGVEALHSGDVVEVEIPQIGTLRNPVAAEKI
jgi:2-keto-4-pentenoate hydratase/2-oxohepta-3-ene-1,7-dioic acid hydratase in catechol pathway